MGWQDEQDSVTGRVRGERGIGGSLFPASWSRDGRTPCQEGTASFLGVRCEVSVGHPSPHY